MRAKILPPLVATFVLAAPAPIAAQEIERGFGSGGELELPHVERLGDGAGEVLGDVAAGLRGRESFGDVTAEIGEGEAFGDAEAEIGLGDD